MRALGLDVGSKTIGIALVDEAGIAAHPHSVLARVGNSGDAVAIVALTKQHGVTDIVVGMPYELSGKVGHRGRQVQHFIKVLEAAVAPIKIHEQDERFTTAEAERVLIDADVSRAKRKDVIDQQAAALILQTWLDAYRNRTESR
ncbi:MAG: Holliday junction resolvase RuvX [Myxococcota bacterium]|nr:Holliday junction resolvase RuvX [Deltaproteobacteria bacterium]MDQ3334906.1 Holliday junction resolvase RuvX [Myxococcota bacterium]